MVTLELFLCSSAHFYEKPFNEMFYALKSFRKNANILFFTDLFVEDQESPPRAKSPLNLASRSRR